MKRLLKFVVGLVALAALAASYLLAYLFLALPRHPELPVIALPKDAKRLENGRYLAQHVALCVECHSAHDAKRYANPVEETTLGCGGEAFRGGFGVLYASNITPTGIGSWSDQDLYRAVVTGVSPNSKPLFPLMPFPHYAEMDQHDMEDILAYVRSLPPAGTAAPASQLNFPLNVLVRTMSSTPNPQPRPSPPAVWNMAGI